VLLKGNRNQYFLGGEGRTTSRMVWYSIAWIF